MKILIMLIAFTLNISQPLVMFAQTPSGRSITQEQRGIVHADSMKCDGKSDDTAAFNLLISSAVSDVGPAAAPIELQTLQLPGGKCRFASAPKFIPAGIKILGNANRNGTWLIADYNEVAPQNGFLTWDGSFRAMGSGLGGGLQHVHISKGSGKTGGTAIKLVGSDDNHRAGFMLFEDIFINSVFGAAGFWHHHFIIDGSCCTTNGSNGVRDIILNDFHFGQSEPPQTGDSILIRNAVHVYLSNGLIFTSPKGGIHVTGVDAAENRSSHDVLISNVNIEGSLTFENVKGATYNGWLAGKLVTTPTATKCYISGVIEGAIENAGECGLSTDKETMVSEVLTSPSDDVAGRLILTNGSGIYRFKHRFSQPPVCTASDSDSSSPVRVYTTESTLTIAGRANDTVTYICVAK
jgi:hypothetical protein